MFFVVDYYEKWHNDEITDCYFIRKFYGTYKECLEYCKNKEMGKNNKYGYGYYIVEVGKTIDEY